MDVWVNPLTNNRIFEFSPVPELGGLEQSLVPYDPNNGYHYGLYDTAQPSCTVWANILQQYQQYSHAPAAIIDKTGRIHRVMPEWYRHGYKYEPLIRNAKPISGQNFY